MAQTSGPRRTMIDKFRLFSLAEGINSTLLDNYNGEWELYADFQASRFPLRSKSTNPRASSAPTTTPENAKLSPIVPNAPVKTRKSSKRVDLRRRRLDYSEIDENSPQEGVFVGSMKSAPSSAKSGTKTSEEKKCHTSQPRRGGQKLAKCDKENDSTLADRSRIDQSTKQTRNPKIQSKPQNHSKLDSEFSHFRI